MVPVMFNQFGASFEFAGQDFALAPSRALYWAEERALIVADLHLEKASWFAERGQMLPPYDSRETLSRVADALRATGARRVFCLGDNFHDSHGPARLEPHAAGMLDALMRATDWVWITGNHDCQDTSVEAKGLPELTVRGIALRHEARPGRRASSFPATITRSSLSPRAAAASRAPAPSRASAASSSPRSAR